MKIAAIWARVSTQDQRELSLDGQVERVKTKLEGLGYQVPPDMILKTDWTSLDLYSCPPFQQLQQWVKTRQVAALGVLDRDRLAAQGLQRLTFLADCKAAGVEVVPCQGPPMLEGPEGQLVELALAIGKERSVERAQRGSRDGLRDRAKLRGLPSVPIKPYGYTWNENRTKLIPTVEWSNVEFICKAALAGATLGSLCLKLHKQGIRSSTGLEWWSRNAISTVLTNPIYGGRYYAQRWQAVEPKKRKGNTYGKSGSMRTPLSEALYLPNVEVVTPPLTWEEWESLQQRRQRNKLMAQRHARTDYLLRSLIVCETHHRRYHGHGYNRSWDYVCGSRGDPGASKCPTPTLNGPELEAGVKAICQEILTKPEIIEAKVAKHSGQVQVTLESISKKLTALDAKEARAKTVETNLVIGKAIGDASPEAYDRALAQIKAQKAWIVEERERLQAELAAAQRHNGALISIGEARERLCALLERGSNDDWREVFNALAVQLQMGAGGQVELSLAIPIADVNIVSTSPRFPSPSCECSDCIKDFPHSSFAGTMVVGISGQFFPTTETRRENANEGMRRTARPSFRGKA